MRWWAHLSPDVVHEEDEYGDDDGPDILRYQFRDHSKENAKPRVGWKSKENRVNILKTNKMFKSSDLSQRIFEVTEKLRRKLS